MGRTKLYITEEEKKEAARRRKRAYYDRHRTAICRERRRQYALTIASATDTGVPKSKNVRTRCQPLTEEERKARERAKASRYYAGHKSEVQARRREGRRTVDHTNGIPTASRTQVAPGPVWQQHIDFIAAQAVRIRLGQDTKTYAQNIAKAFLSHHDPDQVLSGSQQLDTLLARAYRLEHDILNQLGVGPLMSSLLKVIAEIREVINCVQDIWGFAVLGLEAFREACIDSSFMYMKL